MSSGQLSYPRELVQTAAKLGFWSSGLAFCAATGYGIAQILQLSHLLAFPIDEIAIFGFSLILPLPFVVAMASLRFTVECKCRVWTEAAMLMAVIYACLVLIVYPTQLALVIPAKISGRLDSVSHLTVTRGTFIWVIDGVGYLVMGFSTLFAAAAFDGDPSKKWLRRFLLGNFLINPLIAAIYAFPQLLLFGAIWLITAPGSLLLLSKYFGDLVKHPHV